MTTTCPTETKTTNNINNHSTNTRKKIRIGLAITEKKWHKHLFSIAKQEPIYWIWLTKDDLLSITYLESLSLDMVIHKMSDFLFTSIEENMIYNYFENNIPLLDSVQSVTLLSSRIRTCLLLMDFEHPVFSLPPTIILKTKITTIPSSLSFPLILKPDIACSTLLSHSMTLIFSQSQIPPNPSHILQQYIPHYGILCKVYVIFGTVSIVLRKSLSLPINQTGEIEEAHTFDSQTMRRDPLNVKDELIIKEYIKDRKNEIDSFTNDISKLFGNLKIFGWDLIFEEGTGKPFIIDLNYFPGFDNVDFINTITDNLINTF